MQTYLQPGRFIDSDHPALIEFAERWRGAGRDPRDQAVALYRAVRDQVRYNPYVFSREPQTLKASHALLAGESYCVPKANLLAACARHCGIPARIGLADVRNHLSTPRLLQLLRSEVFAMHGSVSRRALGQGHAGLQRGTVPGVQGGAAGVRRCPRQRLPSL